MSDHKYWAAAPIAEIAAALGDKFTEYQEWLTTSGYASRIRRSYNRYYSLDADGGLGLESSEDGAVSHMAVNHYKNLIKRIHILITQAKLSYLVRARNSDTRSQLEADLGKGILEYYNDEKGMNGVMTRAAETALVCHEAFIHAPWDHLAGDEVAGDVETLQVERTGDQCFEVLTAMDVARSTQGEARWYIVRTLENKYDLAAQYPQFDSQILAGGQDTETRLRQSDDSENDDLVDVLYFYHDQTPALPSGRYTVVCNDAVLADGPLGYKKLPVIRLSAGDVIETVCGDSPGADLLPIQEVIDKLFSAIASNNLNFSMQNIWTQDPNMSVKKLSEGQNLIVSAAKPEALQLTNSSPENYKFLELLVNHQQLLSGINSTARGQPEASLKSGNSLALMLAQAIQYVNDFQANYAQAASEVGTCVINNIQKFAAGNQLVVIGGKSRQSYVREFQAQDIANIDRVSVDLGNPIAQTTAGRYELVQMWTQNGVLKSPKQVIEFLKTGQTDSLLEDEYKDIMLVRAENEAMKAGQVPVALLTDMHPYHVQEHRDLLNDPDARKDPTLVQAVLAHIQEHINQARMMPPDLAAMLAGQPPPPPQGGPQAGIQAPPGGPNLPNTPPNTPPQVKEAYQKATGSGEP